MDIKDFILMIPNDHRERFRKLYLNEALVNSIVTVSRIRGLGFAETVSALILAQADTVESLKKELLDIYVNAGPPPIIYDGAQAEIALLKAENERIKLELAKGCSTCARTVGLPAQD